MVPVYYCPVKPSNTISSCDIKFYPGFQKVAYEHLEHCDFVYPQGSSWRSPYETRKILDYLQIKKFKVKPQRKIYIVVPTFCGL